VKFKGVLALQASQIIARGGFLGLHPRLSHVGLSAPGKRRTSQRARGTRNAGAFWGKGQAKGEGEFCLTPAASRSASHFCHLPGLGGFLSLTG
jgi:hypothetical protein